MKNCFEFKRDGKNIPHLHPTQKPFSLLKRLIEIFTDEGDVVATSCFGSYAAFRSSRDLNRDSYSF
ncbi:MAG: hypothetical protein IJQ74_04170 [Synergistaceae bacterium]|nr:hypothetical protein [Synergistaceae bacterium]